MKTKNKVSRFVMIFISLILLVGAVGCEFEDGQAIKKFSGDVQLLSSRVDDYQVEVVKMTGMLEADNVIDSEVIVKLDKIHEEIDRVQPQVNEMAKAIENMEGEELWDIAETINTASAPWNPYAIPIAAVLLAAETITAMFLKKKTEESKVNAALYSEEHLKKVSDKVGRERTLRELAAMDEKDITAPIVKSMMYRNIGDERRGNGVV